MIHSCTLAEHIEYVWEVLIFLVEHGFKTKCAKCAWAHKKVNFCGMDNDKDSIHAQEHKTCAVVNWSLPGNSQNIRYFLGLTSYYRKFIEYYTYIAITLYTIATTPKGKDNVGL